MTSQHLVQFYGADSIALVRDVARYAAEGLDGGEAVILVTGADRHAAILKELDALRGEPVPSLQDARLLTFDSETTLSQLCTNGHPDANRFDKIVGAVVREAAFRSRSHRLRVYGDMVDTLWQRGHREDAIELERYWNDLQAQLPFELYCAYGIDVFGPEFDAPTVAPVLCEHSHIVSGESPELHNAIDYAMYETLGRTCPQLPDAETAILWIRSNLPDEAPGILHRAKRYTAGDS